MDVINKRLIQVDMDIISFGFSCFRTLISLRYKKKH